MHQTSTTADRREQPQPVPVWVARQPIVDAGERLHGYELLYRGDPAVQHAFIACPVSATTEVVVTAAVDVGLHGLVGGGLAFVNVTRDFLQTGRHRMLPAARVVLEVTEDQVVDDDLRAALDDARRDGFRIALDDYVHDSAHTALLDAVDIVKVDLAASSPEDVDAMVPRLVERGVRLLAEKVETREDFERCVALGFELFQGYFFERPTTLATSRVAANRAAALALVAAVTDPATHVADLVELIRSDATLSYKVLRLANSSWAGVRARIDSVRDAVALLGLETVKQLAVVSALLGSERKPAHVLRAGAVRARTCELAARRMRLGSAAEAFTAGVFSLAEPLCGKPLDEILAEIPLPAGVVAALDGGDGPAARLLAAVAAMEHGGSPAGWSPSDVTTLGDCYWEAVVWVGALESHLRA